MINNQYSNTHNVLVELVGSLQKVSNVIDAYFDHIQQREMVNPLLAEGGIRSVGNNEALPPEFFKGFGIRRLILDSPHGRLSFSDKYFTDMIGQKAASFNWHDLKSDLILDDLKMLFANCQIVEFENWSDRQ